MNYCFVFQILIRCFGGVRVYDGSSGVISNGAELYLNGGTVPVDHVLILIWRYCSNCTARRWASTWTTRSRGTVVWEWEGYGSGQSRSECIDCRFDHYTKATICAHSALLYKKVGEFSKFGRFVFHSPAKTTISTNKNGEILHLVLSS